MKDLPDKFMARIALKKNILYIFIINFDNVYSSCLVKLDRFIAKYKTTTRQITGKTLHKKLTFFLLETLLDKFYSES